MTSRLLKRGDLKRMPWKNGGGVTTEVSIRPADAELQRLDFDWRVSMASVETDGPFSLFPGYKRALVVWKGQGLEISGVLRENLEPFYFTGHEHLIAKPIAGPIEDFGVIFKPERYACEILTNSLAEEALTSIAVECDTFFLCARGELRVDSFYLNPGDLVHTSGQGALQVKALESSKYVVAQITPLDLAP